MLSLLKDARIKSGEDLESISKKLNIKKNYLIALEEGRFTEIPGDTYVKGYLKLYSKHLNVEYNEIPTEIKIDKPVKQKININRKFQKCLILTSATLLIIIFLLYHLILQNTPNNDVITKTERLNNNSY